MSGMFMSVSGMGLVHSCGGLKILTAQGDAPREFTAPDTSRLSELMPGVSLRRVPRYARMALLAALEALDAAAWRQPEHLQRTALVIGTAYSGAQMSMDFMDSILDNGPQLSSPTAFSHAVNNMGAGLLSLLLGIEGPCFTVSQFELSFAGALTTAATLLAANRAERVLVGAVDEIDSRFTHCCPQLQHPSLPQTEGAAFLCLTRPVPGTPCLRALWECHSKDVFRFFLSGDAAPGHGVTNETLYGHGPLAQALDSLLALELVGKGPDRSVNCLCRASSSKREALIEVRSTL